MIRAAEAAAVRTGRRVHLLIAGWFAGERSDRGTRRALTDLAPTVTSHILDGRDPEIRRAIWSAGDVFVSLVDNIQETFGLTPIEAMAAGLPVVASDWDGYRETVRDGIDGFLIPTIAPGPGHGEDVAWSHGTRLTNYNQYCGVTSLASAVHHEACVDAFTRLIERPDLRRQMGEQGRARAAEFDWSKIIPQYQALWQHLAERRGSAAANLPSWVAGTAVNPTRPDPFLAFASYPSSLLDLSTRLRAVPPGPRDLDYFRSASLTQDPGGGLLPLQALGPILLALRQQGTAVAGDLIGTVPGLAPAAGIRILGWLLKVGLADWDPGPAKW
jgi:hypothetical protein